jgi:prophage DNA circulation protein
MEKLTPGMWRTIPFWIERHSLDGGRRLAVHELPARDVVLVEDMGRKGRRFQLEFFGLYKENFYWRDDMRAALEEPGPGTLNHPYLGEIKAQVEEFTLSERPDELGIFRVQVTFIEVDGELRVSDLEFTDRKQQTREAAAKVARNIAPEVQPDRTLIEATDELIADLRDIAEIAEIATVSTALDRLATAAEQLQASAESLAIYTGALVDAVASVVDALLAPNAVTHRSDPGRKIGYVGESAATIGSQWDDPTAGLPEIASGWRPVAATRKQSAALRVRKSVALAARASAIADLAEAVADIVSVAYSLDDEGARATLDLCPRGAFVPEPYTPKKRPGATWP